MKTITAVLSLLMLGACTATTPTYQAASTSGAPGYTSAQLEDGRYRIAYKIDGGDVALAKDYALLRAAELTLQNGYDYFTVVDRDQQLEKETRTVATEPQLLTYGTTYHECGILTCRRVTRPSYVQTSYARGIRTDVESSVILLEIAMSNQRDTSDAAVYDAADIAKTIRERL